MHLFNESSFISFKQQKIELEEPDPIEPDEPELVDAEGSESIESETSESNQTSETGSSESNGSESIVSNESDSIEPVAKMRLTRKQTATVCHQRSFMPFKFRRLFMPYSMENANLDPILL